VTRRSLALLGALLALLVAVLWGMPAGATSIDAEAGVRNTIRSGAAMPVRISVDATERIDGTLSVSILDSPTPTVVEVPFDAAADTTTDLWVLVPSSPWGGGSVRVELRDGDRQLARRVINLNNDDGETVGVLPDLVERTGGLPPSSALSVPELGTARIGPIDGDLLRLGAAGLGGLGGIAATPADLTSLDDGALTALLTWLERGGVLYVDTDAAGLAQLAAIPEAWRAGDAGYALAGMGEVRLTGGDLAEGRWDEHLVPTAGSVMFGSSPLQGSWWGAPTTSTALLVDESGLDLPSLGGIVPVLLVYVVAVGPLLFVVLKRMRRLTMAWVAVPALAAFTAGVIVVGGSALRREADPAHVTVALTGETGTMWRTSVLSPASGTRSGVQAPEGWVAAADLQGWNGTSRRTVFDLGDRTVTRSVGPRQVDVVQLVGATAGAPGGGAGPLVVEAASPADGVVTGTVRNDGALAVHDVAVLSGSAEMLVGDLAPGATAEFELADVDRRRLPTSPFQSVWADPTLGEMVQFGGPAFIQPPPGTDTPEVRMALLQMAVGDAPNDFTALGTVLAAGFAIDTGPVPLTNGDVVTTGRTLVMARTAIAPVGGVPTDVTTMRRDVRNGSVALLEATPNGNTQSLVSRFVIDPATASNVDRWQLMFPSLVREAAIWDGDDWLRVEPSDGPLIVPDDAVIDGSVLVRADLSMNQIWQGGQPIRTDDMTLSPARNGDGA
jgi:hypothetical protein